MSADSGVVKESVHKFDYGHKFAGAASASVVAGGAEREIVAASLEPGSSVSVVARRYEVNVNQVFAWRKRSATRRAPLRLSN